MGEAVLARKTEGLQGFRWFETVDEAFEAMLPAIDGARRSVRLEMYIYRASPIGERVREALIRAVERKVQVRVLLDALGSVSLPEKFWDGFVAAGGEFRWFNPIKLKRLGFRNHRKSLTIDDEVSFIGGFNIAPEYQGDGLTKGWHDLGIQLPRALAQEVGASFDLHYSLADYRHRRLARYRRSAVARIAQTPSGELLTNAPGLGKHFMKGALLRDIATAGRTEIVSGYFLPPRQMRRGMMKAARQGRPVRVILGAKSDVILAQLAARHLYSSLLGAGVQIFEYEPQILHTKLFLFDDAFYAGSANMDKRSLLVNYELLARVTDRELTEQARAVFERALEHCRRIELEAWRDSRTVWSRLKEQWAYFVLSKMDPYFTQLQLNVLHREILADQPAAAAGPS